MRKLKHNPSFGGLLSAVLLLAAASALAQVQAASSTEPPPTPEQLSVAATLPLNPALPTVFIVGDSTARNQADLGWGDHLARYFDTNRINVANRAIADVAAAPLSLRGPGTRYSPK